MRANVRSPPWTCASTTCGRPAPGRGVTAEAHCYKLTRSIGFVRAEAWDVDRGDLVATAQAAFMLNRARPLDERGRRPTRARDAFLQRVPYVRFLGMRVELAGDEMTAVLPFAQHLVGNPTLPALHGGVIGRLPGDDRARPALPGPAAARACPRPSTSPSNTCARPAPRRPTPAPILRKVGRRVANVHVEAWQESRDQARSPSCAATSCCAAKSRPPRSSSHGQPRRAAVG